MEKLSKLHEEIIIRSTIIDQISEHKNTCAHSILQALEFLVGKDTEEWITIRKVVLDNINDYHRSVCDMLDRVM